MFSMDAAFHRAFVFHLQKMKQRPLSFNSTQKNHIKNTNKIHGNSRCKWLLTLEKFACSSESFFLVASPRKFKYLAFLVFSSSPHLFLSTGVYSRHFKLLNLGLKLV